jgi:hypothetical protein
LKGILHSFNNGIETMPLCGWVGHGEAGNDPTAATEHHLLVKDFAALFSTKYKPSAPAGRVGDRERAVRLAS